MYEDVFIEMIQQHECVWNTTSNYYSNKLLKMRIWRSISEEYGKSVEECMALWKKLKTKFNREKKYWEGKTGSGADFKEEWPLYQKMLFLNDASKPRQTYSNLAKMVAVDEVDEQSEADQQSEADEHGEADEHSQVEHFEQYNEDDNEVMESCHEQESTPDSDQRKDSIDNYVVSHHAQHNIQPQSQLPSYCQTESDALSKVSSKAVILSNIKVPGLVKLVHFRKEESVRSPSALSPKGNNPRIIVIPSTSAAATKKQKQTVLRRIVSSPNRKKHPIPSNAAGSTAHYNRKNLSISAGAKNAEKRVSSLPLSREEWKAKIKKSHDKSNTAATSIANVEKTFDAAVRNIMRDDKPGTKFDSLGRYIADFLNDMPKDEANLKERRIIRILED